MKENAKLPVRSAENVNRRSKDSSNKYNKITKKSLNAAFMTVSEDASEASKDSESSAPISEISHADGDGELSESSQTWIEQASSVNLLRSDMTPSEKITDGEEKGLLNCLGASELDSPTFASLEAEIAENFLRKAQSEVFNSLSASPQYRKLMNEIINFVLEELHTVPEERDRIAEVIFCKKSNHVSICLVMDRGSISGDFPDFRQSLLFRWTIAYLIQTKSIANLVQAA